MYISAFCFKFELVSECFKQKYLDIEHWPTEVIFVLVFIFVCAKKNKKKSLTSEPLFLELKPPLKGWVDTTSGGTS